MGEPTLIVVDHDDYHAQHVGRTTQGRQFFLTTPFEPGLNEYVALYLFDAHGRLIEALIDEFGPRNTMDEQARRETYERRLNGLGPVTFERIQIAPFAVERFGTTFGFVVCAPEDDDDMWTVEVQPGNYMAFFEPWDSGDYDT